LAGNNIIDVRYDGGGQKLRKTVTNNGTVQYVQNYVGGIEYRTNSTVSLSLESIYHGEGRVFNTNTGTITADALRYEYAIRDHLGNTRLMFTDKNADGKIDITTTASTEVLQENHYYPFGMNMSGPWQDDAAARNNQYLYNGKELNEDFGLGWNDYGFRWYDVSVARWWSLDLETEKHFETNPFHYVFNNPLKLMDFMGLDSISPKQAAQAVAAHASYTMVKSEQVRKEYEKEVKKLDSSDKAGRSKLKAAAREKTPVVTKTIVETNRPSVDAKPGSGGTANKTNLKVNQTASALGTAGRALGMASAAVSVYNISNSDNKPQAIVREGASMAGSIYFGEQGAMVGAAIGGVPGAIIGAVVGGVFGSWFATETVDSLSK
jgi:RHS repeat-associated protein